MRKSRLLAVALIVLAMLALGGRVGNQPSSGNAWMTYFQYSNGPSDLTVQEGLCAKSIGPISSGTDDDAQPCGSTGTGSTGITEYTALPEGTWRVDSLCSVVGYSNAVAFGDAIGAELVYITYDGVGVGTVVTVPNSQSGVFSYAGAKVGFGTPSCANNINFELPATADSVRVRYTDAVDPSNSGYISQVHTIVLERVVAP